MEKEFEKLTADYLRQTDVKYRKSLGQYFTPKTLREKLVKALPLNQEGLKVLDPSCGTGEFLITAKKYFKKPDLYGWDIDKNLIELSGKNIPEAKLKACDALKASRREKYDIVLGNPPYFEFPPNKYIKERYKKLINGRVNIFNLFFGLGLELLKDGGHLAYVVSPSMNNGAYFQKLRKYIIKNAEIEYLEIINDPKLFHGAQQLTMLIVLRKGKNSGKYVFKHNGIEIFSEKNEKLKKAFDEKKTLHDIGYNVRTGRIVWNLNKDKLTNEANGNIPLIWSHNLVKGKLHLDNNHLKKQYLITKSFDTGPAVVVNRITGAARSAKLRGAFIPSGMKFLAENHCNVIFPPKSVKKEEAESILKEILAQLTSKKNSEIIQNITGNTQISKTELEKLFPLDI